MPNLALLGGNPLRNKEFHPWPISDDLELKHIEKVVKSNKWSGHLEFENEFSKRFAKFQGLNHAVCTTSGMMALLVALKALDVGPGDEVIIPAFPRPTELAVAYAGAEHVFVDVDPNNFCIDPNQVISAITPKTKAIIIIHTHNTMADMDEFIAIREKYNIPIIEDCAHAHGMKWEQKGAGSIGDIGIFSFQETKSITCGEGGLICTESQKLFDKIHSLIDMAKGVDRKDLIPWNLRITEYQAAILLAQLDRFPSQIEKKLANIKYFEQFLDEIDGIDYIRQHKKIKNATGFLYTLIYDKQYFRNTPLWIIASALMGEGLPIRMRSTSYSYPAIKTYLKKYKIKPSFPLTEKIMKETLFTLPHPIFLGEKEDIDDIVKIINKVKNNIHELKGYRIKHLAERIKNKVLVR